MSTTLLIVFVIFFIFAAIGFVRGFLKKVFTIATLLACIFIAGALVGPFSSFLKTTPVYSSIYNGVYGLVDNNLGQSTAKMAESAGYGWEDKLGQQEVTNIENNSSQVSGLVNSYVGNLPVPTFLQEKLVVTSNEVTNQAKEAGNTFKNVVISPVATKISDFIIRIIAYLIICLGIYIVMRIIFAVIGLFSKIKVLSLANRMGGLVLGIIEAIFIVWLFMTLITLAAGTVTGQNMLQDINNNGFLSTIYQANPIWRFFK